MIAVAVLVFVADTLADYMAGRYQDARMARRPRETAAWSAAIALLVSVNVLGVVSTGVPAILASVAGSYLGTLLSFRR